MPADDIRSNLNNFIDDYLIFVPDSISLVSGLGSMVKQDQTSDRIIEIFEITIANLMLLGKQINEIYPLESSNPSYDYTTINLVLNNIVTDISTGKNTLSTNIELCKPKLRTGSIANKYAYGSLNGTLIEGSNNASLESLFQVKDTIPNASAADYSLALIGPSGVTLLDDILSDIENLDNIIESKLSLTNTQDDSTSTLETLIQGLN